VRRVPQRAVYDRAGIDAILDQAIVSHLGVIDEAGFPIVTPTLHAREGDHVYFHGSAANRTLREAARAEICLTATLLDGLVMARSAFHHSVNYRSAMVFGRAEQIEGPEEKCRALEIFTEKLVPGRWADVRPPSDKELRGTSVLRISLDEASAKVRTGPPVDEEADYELPAWAGVIGLRLIAGAPEPDQRLAPGIELPDYLGELIGGRVN
jgi:nitroimidazol reductase NimA-like FMN-containing flavoprotein (pyridoxamine 5'-phosphate oxidase superfamily)